MVRRPTASANLRVPLRLLSQMLLQSPCPRQAGPAQPVLQRWVVPQLPQQQERQQLRQPVPRLSRRQSTPTQQQTLRALRAPV